MPATIGEGIASGITNAIALGLRSEANDIRNERTEALERASGNKLALDLEKFEFTKSQAEQEFEAGQPERDLQKLERSQALELEAKKKNFLSVENHLTSRVGDNQTPDQVGAFKNFLDAMLPGKARNGEYNEFDVDSAFREAIEGDSAVGAGLLKEFFNVGKKQAANLSEVNKAELTKLQEKNPMLATNPEALKADEKASTLAQSVDELDKTSKQFGSQAAEMEEVEIQGKARRKAKLDRRAAAFAELEREKRAEIFKTREEKGLTKEDIIKMAVRMASNPLEPIPIEDAIAKIMASIAALNGQNTDVQDVNFQDNTNPNDPLGLRQ